MKNKWLIFLFSLAFASCNKEHKMQELSIDYPAAYVVNGEDGTISVIKLSTNSVSETIELMTAGMNSMLMWRHHISFSDKTELPTLAVGVPGMDMSLGHMGSLWMKHGEFVTGTDDHAIVFNGNRAYVTNQRANTVSVFDVLTHTKIKDIPVGKKPNGITIKL